MYPPFDLPGTDPILAHVCYKFLPGGGNLCIDSRASFPNPAFFTTPAVHNHIFPISISSWISHLGPLAFP
jgi:hypothetical protein